jgi:hypothetical protein
MYGVLLRLVHETLHLVLPKAVHQFPRTGQGRLLLARLLLAVVRDEQFLNVDLWEALYQRLGFIFA